MFAEASKLCTSTQLAENLISYPSLMLFIFPWTCSALTAFVYIQTSLFVALVRTNEVSGFVLNAIGFCLCLPWVVLALKSLFLNTIAVRTLWCKQKGVYESFQNLKRSLHSWFPKSWKESIRIFSMVVIWAVVSLPFSILVGQLFHDSRITLALFLVLLLTPYWLLVMTGIYLVVGFCFSPSIDLHEQIELVSQNSNN